MASAAELRLVATVQDKASAQLVKLRKQMAAMQKQANSMGRSFKILSPIISTGITASILASGAAFNEVRDRATRAFTAMLGDGPRAVALLDQLATLAENSTFGFEDITQAAQRMMSFGFAVEDIIPTLNAVNGAVTAMGGSGESVNRVIIALGQMQAKGKASAEEMMQLAEAGIPAWQILSENIDQIFGAEKAAKMRAAMEVFKTNTAEKLVSQGMSAGEAQTKAALMATQRMTSQLMDLSQAGKLPADKVIAALRQGMQTRFGALAAGATKTTGEELEALTDRLKRLFGDLTKTPLQQVGVALATIGDGVKWLNEQFNLLDGNSTFKSIVSWLTTLTLAAVAVGGALAVVGALGPTISAIGTALGWVVTAAAWFGALLLAITPVGWAIIAVTAAVAGLVAVWLTDFLGIRTKLEGWFAAVGPWFTDFKDKAIQAFKDFYWKALEYVLAFVADIPGQTWKGVKGAIDAIWEFRWVAAGVFVAAWDYIVGYIDTAKRDMIAKLSAMWDVVGGWVSSIADDIKYWFKTGWDGAANYIDTIKTTMANKIAALWTALFPADGSRSWFTALVQDMSSSLAGVWSALITPITSLGANISNGIAGIWDSIFGSNGSRTWFTALVDDMAYWLGSVWPALITPITNLGANISNGISGIWEAIFGSNGSRTWFSALVQDMTTWLASVWPALITPITNLGTNISNGIAGIWASIFGENGSRTWFQALIQDMRFWLEDVWNGLITPIQNLGTNISNAISGVWESIFGGNGRPRTWFQALYQDMRSALDSVWGAITTAPVEAIKSAFRAVYRATAIGFNALIDVINSAYTLLGWTRLTRMSETAPFGANPANPGFTGAAAMSGGGGGTTIINHNYYLNAEVVTTTDAQAWWRRMQDESRARGVA